MIREAMISDAKIIASIYNYYVENTAITFEEELITSKEIIKRMGYIQKKYPWFVFIEDGQVLGYAYANKWRERSAYRFAVEISIYLDHRQTGKGIGSKLMAHLLENLKLRDIRCIIGGITIPNPGSIAIHEKFGFHKVAQFEKVGYKFDKWLDVGYWQLNVEGDEDVKDSSHQ
ncbi:GNAT family N-acetyltransferase [Vallitalea okinawensis]|uniref:GNAT family N-acetyltransferase n=1 Tax=Vallitalea okinawensis TaxID=2078660 RepID=UPI000CFBC950|nr:GNAT family N-acetyltransferase [Vallitalea okinawensis]